MFSPRDLKFLEKKQFPSKLHLFSKGFFNQALGGFDNNALNFSLNSWESFAQNPKKFKISESFKKGIVPQIVSPGTCKPFFGKTVGFFCLKCESSKLFSGKKRENLFFFTKNFPRNLPLDTWIAVSTNLLPKVCHQETGNDLKKKYQKDELSSESTSGHVEWSFENPSRKFSPKGVDFLAQIPWSVLN